METKHYLFVSHILSVFFVNEDHIVCILCTLQREIDLVEYERVIIVKVCVPSCMNETHLNWHNHSD